MKIWTNYLCFYIAKCAQIAFLCCPLLNLGQQPSGAYGSWPVNDMDSTMSPSFAVGLVTSAPISLQPKSQHLKISRHFFHKILKSSFTSLSTLFWQGWIKVASIIAVLKLFYMLWDCKTSHVMTPYNRIRSTRNDNND